MEENLHRSWPEVREDWKKLRAQEDEPSGTPQHSMSFDSADIEDVEEVGVLDCSIRGPLSITLLDEPDSDKLVIIKDASTIRLTEEAAAWLRDRLVDMLGIASRKQEEEKEPLPSNYLTVCDAIYGRIETFDALIEERPPTINYSQGIYQVGVSYEPLKFSVIEAALHKVAEVYETQIRLYTAPD